MKAAAALAALLLSAASLLGRAGVADDDADVWYGMIGNITGGRKALLAPASAGSRPPPPPLEALFRRFASKQEALNAVQALMVPQPAGGVQAAYYDKVSEATLRQFWSAWKTHYRKTAVYANNPRMDTTRFKNFRANVVRIANSLQDFTRPSWYKFNSRMDQPPGSLNGGNNLPIDLDAIDAEPVNPSNVSVWDWRQLGKVTPAKDQGECKGCWAFAGVAAIESKILIDTGANASSKPLLDLSEQQLLDCANPDAGFESQGCEGGYLYDPFIYASGDLGFLTTELNYPLTGKSGACDDSRLLTVDGASKYELGVDAYATVRPWSAAGLREAVLISPVVVSIFDTGLFQFYSGGLWTAADCEVPAGPPSFSTAKTNHAVLVVGFNMTARPPYWIIKNSWGSGESWGDDGFGMIEMIGLDGKPSWGACSMYFWMLRPAEVLPRQGDPVPPAPKTPTLRLMNGRLATQEQYGRLEILVNGTWSTICNRGFDSVDASIACRQLGLGTSGRALANTPFGQGNGLPIALNQVECTGEEQALEQCGSLRGAAGVSGCTHAEDVTIECGDALPDETVRLVSLDGIKERGRLEVLHKGSWGTVCDDGMTDDAASVVCSQLGLGSSGSTIKHAPFGEGNGTIWLSRVRCTGKEYRLEYCPHAPWGNAAGCTHSEDVGISCLGTVGSGDTAPGVVTVRLVGGSSKRQGRLEVLQKGLWRTVCDDGADSGLASVVCKQLGLPSNPVRNTTVGGAYYGQGSGGLPIYLHCTGTETSWEQCSTGGLGTRSCSHAEDVGVSCGARLDAMVRLAGVPNARSGRLEVRRNGLNSTWGTVCSRGFDPLDARVVCRTLGLGLYGVVVATSVFGPGTGRIWMSDVACTGFEATLLECTSRAGQACTHAMDVGIRCSDTPPGLPTLRLADGINSTSGRLEMLQDGVWGTICDDGGTDAMATVACRQLGLGSAGILKTNAYFGEGTGPIYMGGLTCSGSETRLQDCPSFYGNDFSCRHYSDVGVICYDPPAPLYRFAGKWGGRGDADGLFQSIHGMAATRDGDMFVCDDDIDNVQHFTDSGSFVATFGAGQLSSPSGITQMGSSNDLLVVDRSKQRIERYTLQGQKVGGFRANFKNDTLFTNGIIERGGTIYLADPSSCRIISHATDGTFLRQWGTPGVQEGQLSNPCGLGLDRSGQTLYVLECGLGRVSRFATADLRFLGSFGRKQLFAAVGMCLTEDGNVVVAHETNVLVFTSNDTLAGSFPYLQPGDNATLAAPTAIACSVDGSRAVFVSDLQGRFVRKFLPAGQPAAVAARHSTTRGAAALAAAGEADAAPQKPQVQAAAAVAATEAARTALPAHASLARMQDRVAAFAADLAALPLSPLQLERLAWMADRHAALLDTFQQELQVQG